MINSELTALYRHLKLSEVKLLEGDKVQAGQTIAFLRGEFSNQTEEERKHLHFAIYKGQDLYFKGYENTKEALQDRWIDPLFFLKTKITDNKEIISLLPSISEAPSISSQPILSTNNFLEKLWNLIKQILRV